MNQWILPISIVLLVFIVGAFAFVNAYETGNQAQAEQKIASCGSASCNGLCSAENNCGSPSCGAVKGGSCGCGKYSERPK